MKRDISFIGLGVMGSNIASHLIKYADSFNIINRDSIKTRNFVLGIAPKRRIAKLITVFFITFTSLVLSISKNEIYLSY